jgi:hypothetical protein
LTALSLIAPDCGGSIRLTGGEVIGRKSGNYAGIVIPYFRPGELNVREYRLRRDQPDIEYDPGATSNLDKSTSVRRAAPTCFTSCRTSIRRSRGTPVCQL